MPCPDCQADDAVPALPEDFKVDEAIEDWRPPKDN
jgi:hypothetical protein